MATTSPYCVSTLLHSYKQCWSWNIENGWRMGTSCAFNVGAVGTGNALAFAKNAATRRQLRKSGQTMTVKTSCERVSSIKESYVVEEKLDKDGLLRTPRAARELALCVLYAARVADVQPVQILQQRMKPKTGAIYKHLLKQYNHSPSNGDPVYVDDLVKETELQQQLEEEAVLEAAILTAPFPSVYNKFVLSMAQRIIETTQYQWSQQEAVLKEFLPRKWQQEPQSVLLQVCILHMAMAEMTVHGLSSKIVINEAVELAKRFCDGAAFRIINGCLGSFTCSPGFQQLVSAVKQGP